MADEGMALMEKAAAQGHAYAMRTLAGNYASRNEHERAKGWATKGAETGCPDMMAGRGLHSSTLQLNLSAFYVTGGTVRGCFRGWYGVLRVFRVCFCVRNGSS